MFDLDEQSLRRPEFQAGQEVVLADGQAWTFPCPKVYLIPVRNPAGRIVSQVESSFGSEFQAEVDIFEVATTASEEAMAFFSVAMLMLGMNYDLTPDQYRGLLRYRPGDLESSKTVLDVFRIATGYGVVTERASNPDPELESLEAQ